MNVNSETNQSPKWRYALLFGIACLPFIWNLWTERYFSADGAGYFRSLIESAWFQDFAWSRNHAAYLSQWPIVLGVNAGITDYHSLKILFGLGLFFPCIAAFILCWIFVEKKDEPLLLMPTFSVLSLTLAGDSIMTGEHHLLVYIVWPILILLLRNRAFGLISGTVLVLLMVLHLRLYESALTTGSLMIAIIGFRMFFGTDAGGKQRRLHWLLLLLAISSVLIAGHAVIFPRDPTNKGHFLAAMFVSLGSQTFITSVTFILPAIIGLIAGRVKWIWAGLLGFIALSTIWLATGQQTYASISFASRALTLWYLPLIMFLTVGLKACRQRLTNKEWLPICIFVSLASALYVSSSRGWLDFRNQFKSELQSNNGFIHVEDTQIYHHPQRWGWTSAMLSYYWSDGDIKTIILNSKETEWEPFPPQKVRILKTVFKMHEDLESQIEPQDSY